MDQSFFIYLEKLEFIAFFSGYPLIYLISVTLAEQLKKKKILKFELLPLLPVAYTLVGLLFVGLQIKKLYPNFSAAEFWQNQYNSGLFIWALLSLFFWLPLLRKKPIWSFLHSLVFFYLILEDLFLRLFKNADPHIIKNDMHVYTDSLLLNFSCVLCTVLVYFLYYFFKKKRITLK